jgi:hypothetical protein
MLKLTKTKDTFKVTQPRTGVDFNKYVKVTPLFFMNIFIEGISDAMQSGILRFKYIKDNLQEREMFTTLSTPILLSCYPQEFVQTMYSNCGNNLGRGYIKVPELGVSKYDQSGVRALNISRITSIEPVNDFDRRFINVDFDSIMTRFKSGIDSINSFPELGLIYQDIIGDIPPAGCTLLEMKARIEAFVDSQYALQTSPFLKKLHLFMLSYSKLFNNYTGARVAYTGMNSSFDLGVIH